jgi:pimeloyl-ACP methyl ester carboxylesterase
MPTLLVAVAALCALLVAGLLVLRSSALQRRIVFFPEVLADDVALRFSRPHTEHLFASPTGSRLHLVRFGAHVTTADDANADRRRRALLYLHGNAGSLRSWGEVGAELAALLANGGRDDVVYVLDYAGYGRSRGVLDEATILRDVVAVYDDIAARHGDVVVFGRSIGTGPATHLARARRPTLLILETPYASLVDLAGRLLPWLPSSLLAFRFESEVWMKDVRCPVHILHGTDDEVIPLASAERLVAGGLPPGSSVTIIPGGHHNNLEAFPAWGQTIRRVLLDDGPAR